MASSIEEKITIAEGLKSEGNELFKQKLYKKAVIKYNTVFAYINGLDDSASGLGQYAKALQRSGPSMEEKERMTALRITTESNLAACYLKIPSKASMALAACEKVLALDPENTKGLFRKAQALVLLNEFENAKRICEDRSGEKDFDRILRDLKTLETSQRRKEAKAYKNMFA